MSVKLGLSANVLKIIAAVSMVIDHVGVMLFPEITALRVAGRLAFPIFSFMICEGCRYTKNKVRYLLQVFLLGVITSVVYYLSGRGIYLSVPVTFSCSIILIYIIQLGFSGGLKRKIRAFTAFLVTAAFFYWLTRQITIDYGFWGIMLPVFPAVIAEFVDEQDGLLLFQDGFFGFALGLIILSAVMGGVQMYSVFSLLLLALYNGKKGIRLPKYFFYIFYPLHIGVIWIISQMI